VGEKGRLHLRPGRGWPQSGQPAEDARGAKPALAGAPGDETVDQPVEHLGGEAVDGRHRSARDAPHRGDAGHPRRPVDENGAATALALGAAPVLDAGDAYLLAQSIEKGGAFVVDLYEAAVEIERNGQIS
jgi:hypothetical protein